MKIQKIAALLLVVLLTLLSTLGVTRAFAGIVEDANANWRQVNVDGFGDPNNNSGSPVTFNGQLYATTYNNSTGAKIFQYADSVTWTPVMTDGFGNPQNIWVSSTGVFSDALYLGTQNNINGAEIWKSLSGSSWTGVSTGGFGDSANTGIYDFEVINGSFYAATKNDNGGQVWRSANGSDWSQVNPTGFGAGNWGVWSLAAYQGNLYAGVGGSASIWQTSNGTSWTQVISNGFGDSGNTILGYKMTVFENALYATTFNDVTGTEIWRKVDSLDWAQVNIDGFGNSQNTGARSIFTFNGDLYVGNRNEVDGASIWKTPDGTTWTQVAQNGFGDSNNDVVWGIAEYNGGMYAGTSNSVTGGEVWEKSRFDDVNFNHWAYSFIEAIAAAGLTAGYPDGTYGPDNPVTRAEMAVFLKKGIHGSSYTPPTPDGSSPFGDIAGHWAEAWMEELYDEGLTSGYPDGTYRPENRVSRAEMAVFLLKAMHGSGYTPPVPSGGSFTDVSGHWAEAWIEQLKSEGITSGYPDGTYRPENQVTRAEMAVFLVNAFSLPLP